MHVLTFSGQFVAKVESGAKPHTIRERRRRPIHQGDTLSLRAWVGIAYRRGSTVRLLLGDRQCTRLRPIKIYVNHCGEGVVQLDGVDLFCQQIDTLAVCDGFETSQALFDYFNVKRIGDQFVGDLIEWNPKEAGQ